MNIIQRPHPLIYIPYTIYAVSFTQYLMLGVVAVNIGERIHRRRKKKGRGNRSAIDVISLGLGV